MHDVDVIISNLSQKLNAIFYDREFVGSVKEDLDLILQNEGATCVLFPKLKPIFLKALRYEAIIFGLKVFYIGEGLNRVAVVCKESLFVEETNGYCQSKPTQKVTKDIKIMEEEETRIKDLSKKGYRTSRPTQRFYVPPARRVLTKKNSKSSGIYITNVDSTDVTTNNCNVTTTEATDIIITKECEISKNQQELIGKSVFEIELNTAVVPEPKDLKDIIPNNPEDSFSSSDASITSRAAKFLDTGEYKNDLFRKPEELISKLKFNDSIHICFSTSEGNFEAHQIVANVYNSEAIQLETFNISAESPSSSSEISLETKMSNQLINMSFENQDCDIAKEESVEKQLSFNESDNNVQLNSNANLYISVINEGTDRSQFCKDDGDNENNKIQRTIENINRRSKSLIKHVPADDTLRIEENEQQISDSSSYNSNKSYPGFHKNRVKETNVSNWEDMFDENGELQKEYIGEITKHIGCDVQILKATNDYSSYQNILLQDLDHVIELYDFPSTFKTQDIIQLYSDAYQDSMYVKWCDDTHALLVLSTPAQAQRALQIEHDIIKSRPMNEASKIATLIAECTDLKPSMKRPPTNMQTARRLINTHLGTKIKLSKEALEQERKILLSAREQKRLERQNEKDAWEGNPRNTRLYDG